MEDITFFSTCASEFCEIYVGSGPKKVREMFELARENRPAILFIDELESVGFKRTSDSRSYANNIERYSTLNQLLSELDGITENENLVVIAATNREDLLDAALTRPGRFDYKINLELPDKHMRNKIFKLYLHHFKYDEENINEEIIEMLAEKSKNLTGANIEAIVNEAATLSFSKNETFITKEDFEASFNKNMNEFYKFNGFNQEKDYLFMK
jgi:cell division protease FtsH